MKALDGEGTARDKKKADNRNMIQTRFGTYRRSELRLPTDELSSRVETLAVSLGWPSSDFPAENRFPYAQYLKKVEAKFGLRLDGLPPALMKDDGNLQNLSNCNHELQTQLWTALVKESCRWRELTAEEWVAVRKKAGIRGDDLPVPPGRIKSSMVSTTADGSSSSGSRKRKAASDGSTTSASKKRRAAPAVSSGASNRRARSNAKGKGKAKAQPKSAAVIADSDEEEDTDKEEEEDEEDE
jgi:hypothetical protein